MRKLVLFPLFLLGYAFLNAQVPGYQGKRASVQFNLNTFPALSLKNYNGNGGLLFGGNFGMNTRYTINLDYIISRSTTLGLTGQYYRTNPSLSISKNKDLLTGQAFGIYARSFNYQGKGAIAPIGQYYKFELLLLTYKTSFWTEKINILGNTTNYYKKTNHVSLGATITTGKQLILFDHIILDSGLQIGFIPSGLKYIALDTNKTTEAQLRLSTHFLFNIHLGIGFMAF